MGTTSAIRIRGGTAMIIVTAIVDRVTAVVGAELAVEMVVLAALGGGRRIRAVVAVAVLVELEALVILLGAEPVVLVGRSRGLVITTRRGAV